MCMDARRSLGCNKPILWQQSNFADRARVENFAAPNAESSRGASDRTTDPGAAARFPGDATPVLVGSIPFKKRLDPPPGRDLDRRTDPGASRPTIHLDSMLRDAPSRHLGGRPHDFSFPVQAMSGNSSAAARP